MTLIKSSERTVDFWQKEGDANFLARGNYKLYMAHSILSTNGQPIINLIWKCLENSPRRTISWEPIYGLNWCGGLPQGSGPWSNDDFCLRGAWQRCELGQAYALSASGFWTASSGDSKMKCLQVSRNEYQAGVTEPVHVIIGLYNLKTFEFDPVFIDPVELGLNMSASYLPSDIIQWWYQTTGNLSSPISSIHKSPVESRDMSQLDPLTKRFYCSTSYDYSKGSWSTTSSAPPSPISRL